MDLEIIESTFNELMVELSKIKDLNEVAESYKQKTQILSEHLERFLSASENGNNAIMQKTLAIEKALKNINEHMLHDLLNSIGVIIDGMNQKNEEYQKLNAVNLKTITSTLSQIDQNSANFSNKINELKGDNQDSRSKLSRLISESVDGLHHKNELLLSSLKDSIKEVRQSILSQIDQNSANFSNEINELKGDNQDSRSKLGSLISESVDGLHHKNELLLSSLMDSIKEVRQSTLSKIDQNSANFSNEINELKEHNQELRSKLSSLISESVDGLHHKNEILLSSFSNAIKEAQQSISLNIENNENAIKRSHMLSYIQISLMVIIVILFTIGFFVK